MVTIERCETKKTANGKAYKSVTLSNGMQATAWPTVGIGVKSHAMPGYDQLREGSVGDAEITSQEKGDKTYHNIISWNETEAPSERPVSAGESLGAKDRVIALQNAHTGAATIVGAFITSGKVKDLSEALTMMDAIKRAQYEDCVAAASNNYVASDYDPYA